jgi:hypothetical protein
VPRLLAVFAPTVLLNRLQGEQYRGSTVVALKSSNFILRSGSYTSYLPEYSLVD